MIVCLTLIGAGAEKMLLLMLLALDRAHFRQ
jgi:hypothetical protein